MNEWYRAIENYEVEKSHQLQKEIKLLLNHMEEDQTVLLYYSLLDFRMRLNDENPEQKEKATKTLKSIDHNEEQLTGILNYYYWVFKGMYEFKGHNYSAAISCYKVAEKRVEELNDDIEKAEYYYKLSHLYYELNYTSLSINYAESAIAIYQCHPEYLINHFFCKNIIALNMLDDFKFDKAMDTFWEANDLVKDYNDQRLKAIVNINIGIGYMKQELFDRAEPYFQKSLALFLQLNDHYTPKAFFNLFESYVKLGKEKLAESIYKKGIENAMFWGDKEFIAKINLVRELMLREGHKENIDKAFSELQRLNLYPDIESYSIDFAHYFRRKGNLKIANHYYELNILANFLLFYRQQIQSN